VLISEHALHEAQTAHGEAIYFNVLARSEPRSNCLRDPPADPVIAQYRIP
jgi:hypothetical protein